MNRRDVIRTFRDALVGEPSFARAQPAGERMHMKRAVDACRASGLPYDSLLISWGAVASGTPT